MTRGNAHAPAARTGQDRLRDALMFVSIARDHVIRTHTAQSIATMKGVTTAAGLRTIGEALEKRMAFL